jgi:hypothetical protein
VEELSSSETVIKLCEIFTIFPVLLTTEEGFRQLKSEAKLNECVWASSLSSNADPKACDQAELKISIVLNVMYDDKEGVEGVIL